MRKLYIFIIILNYLIFKLVCLIKREISESREHPILVYSCYSYFLIYVNTFVILKVTNSHMITEVKQGKIYADTCLHIYK